MGFFSGPGLGMDVVTCCYSLPVADDTLWCVCKFATFV